ncbi:Beta-barrel assembly machine subunit BamE [Paracoccus pantotrophus]|uniref:Beta-barrel assembly machine subunit BamE n=2 Tax=Paracoccaceae TaxID=31989 RepID=A0A1I5CD84_PARPN|nr:outer membrane protein assembly factor BamE [Paracoccus pantotrophus]QLH13939.1 outer membrane protein assembly factor BamE [Paracoccus pantotrophus]RDE00974.1 outer membrane protein assembly factor BamE [Paracoccus pantotrophus]RKS44091.1 Beta-barrel assembly machine subunit BamE [Paracoccus pantotrophus]RNI17441.1 outer membrane protein assembly factor BamE [Paracoccus pantotrophus]
MKISRRQLMAFALTASLGLSACQATYRNHGYIPPQEQLAQVVVGQTSQSDLEGLIGRPSAQGLLTGSAWYYVGSRWQFYGPREPREVDRQVVAISFSDSGVVSNIERFGLERGQVVVLSRRVTDTGVTSLGLIRQLLGNVGRVQAGDFLGD